MVMVKIPRQYMAMMAAAHQDCLIFCVVTETRFTSSTFTETCNGKGRKDDKNAIKSGAKREKV